MQGWTRRGLFPASPLGQATLLRSLGPKHGPKIWRPARELSRSIAHGSITYRRRPRKSPISCAHAPVYHEVWGNEERTDDYERWNPRHDAKHVTHCCGENSDSPERTRSDVKGARRIPRLNPHAMFREAFGLRRDPFLDTADPAFYYETISCAHAKRRLADC